MPHSESTAPELSVSEARGLTACTWLHTTPGRATLSRRSLLDPAPAYVLREVSRWSAKATLIAERQEIAEEAEEKVTMTIPETDLTRLRKLVTAFTLDFMNSGGTTPEVTCEMIVEIAPDLWARFGRARMLSMCEEVQHAELPVESARMQEMFRTFNEKYFGGKLPDYIICVVYDVSFWQGREGAEPSSGFVDIDRQLITLGYTGQGFEPAVLLHHMIHAANPSFTCNDQAFHVEVERLQALGAPVGITSLQR